MGGMKKWYFGENWLFLCFATRVRLASWWETLPLPEFRTLCLLGGVNVYLPQPTGMIGIP